MITCTGLAAAVRRGEALAAALRLKHARLRGSLHLAHRGWQVGLTSDPLAILEGCEAMVVNDRAKRDVLRLAGGRRHLEDSGRSGVALERVRLELRRRAELLRFVPEVQVELVDQTLAPDAMWPLLADPLVDQELTPQMAGSTRLVLGTLARLCPWPERHPR